MLKNVNAAVAMVSTRQTIQLRNWSQTGFCCMTTVTLRISQLFKESATSLPEVQWLKDAACPKRGCLHSVPPNLAVSRGLDALRDFHPYARLRYILSWVQQCCVDARGHGNGRVPFSLVHYFRAQLPECAVVLPDKNKFTLLENAAWTRGSVSCAA